MADATCPFPDYNRGRYDTMPIEPAGPAFPPSASLVRFFRMPPDALVPLSEVAELLGTTADTVRATLRAESVLPPDGPIPWDEAASYLFDAWPRARILEALGPRERASFLPSSSSRA